MEVRSAVARLEEPRTAWIVLLAAMAIYVSLAMWVTRDTTLFLDEINLFTVDRGFDPYALASPLNGHFVLTQRLTYALDFKVFGADFVPLRLVEAAGVAVVVGLFFVLAMRRIGAAAALAPAILLLFLGSAWELNVVVSGIGNVFAAAAGLGALLALDRPTRRGDVIACVLLVAAVASQTLGVAFAVGAAVLVLLQPESRRRLWVVLVPVAVYAAWFVWVRAVYVPDHGEIQNLSGWNVLVIPNFIADEAASVAGAVAGLNYDFTPSDFFGNFSTESAYGPVLATLAAAALALRLRRGPHRPQLFAFMAILLAFWIALALGFGAGRNPTTVRYVYGGTIVTLLIAAEAARGLRLSRRALLVLFGVTLLALGANLARLRDGTSFFRGFATSLRAELTALELARDHVEPSFRRSSSTSTFAPIDTGSYLAAVDRAGSPAFAEDELLGQPESKRRQADTVLVQALGIAITPAPAGELENCDQAAGSDGVAVQPPGVRLSSSTRAEIALRRFSSSSTVPVGTLPAGQPVELRLPEDRSSRSWQLAVSPASASVTVCQL